MELIDKSKVVAELEKLYNLEYDNTSNLSCGKKIMLRNILLFLDTLEVKEVGEPSKDLEEAASRYSFNIPSAIFDNLPPVLQNIWKHEIEGAFIAGAKWKEEQMQKEAIQMIQDAVERTVKEDAGGYPYIDATELYDYDEDKSLAKAGDKVKVLIVKDK